MLDAIGDRVGKPGLSFEAQCEDKDITGAVLRELQTHGKRVGLQKLELPCKYFFLCAGLVLSWFKN